jgi:hypothetical protein
MPNETLPKITKFFEDRVDGVLNDPTYYQQLFADADDDAKIFHEKLTAYITCTAPEMKADARARVISTYWNFLRSLVGQFASTEMSEPRRFMFRFGAVIPSLFTAEQKDCFSKVIHDNTTNVPVYYMDEWFMGIARKTLAISITDEMPKKRGNEEEHLQELKTSNTGKLRFVNTQMTMREEERITLEAKLKQDLSTFLVQTPHPRNVQHRLPLTDDQRLKPTAIFETMKTLLKLDRELEKFLEEEITLTEIGKSLETKITVGEAGGASSSDLQKELDTVRQMAKMVCGRQGNHFPVFTKEFYFLLPNSTGFRENVIAMMGKIEAIDPGVFTRIHRNTAIRILPEVLLIPCYGDMGICWMPFDHKDVVSSPGRIAIPMYPKNLQVAVLTALADLRWQTAKDKASIFWMEEGISGKYYTWFNEQKLKGSVKESFMTAYMLWILKESTGIQAVDKEVREIFWKLIPFPIEVKQQLNKRSMLFTDLCKRDGIV